MGSNDCGKTWSVRKVIPTSSLETAPIQSNFIPTFSEWKEASVSSLVGNMCVSNFRFKLEFISGGGNDLYIDNINISYNNTTSLSDMQPVETTIYPNPAKNELRVLSEEKMDQILVVDCAGRTVMERSEINDFTVPLNITSLKSGFYHVKISHENKAIQTKSFIKN